MRISDWSSDVCSSDLPLGIDCVEGERRLAGSGQPGDHHQLVAGQGDVDILQIVLARAADRDHRTLRTVWHQKGTAFRGWSRRFPMGRDNRWRRATAVVNMGERRGKIERSEEHTSELQSLMRISYAVYCWT